MDERRSRVRRLLDHLPELSERERLGLVLALGLSGVITMALELLTVAELVQVVRRAWQARSGSGRLTREPARSGWDKLAVRLLLTTGLQLTRRLAFTAYERRLALRDDRGAQEGLD